MKRNFGSLHKNVIEKTMLIIVDALRTHVTHSSHSTSQSGHFRSFHSN